MADVPIRPLLAHGPETPPPRRWWSYLLPAIVALLGMFVALAALRLGAAHQREQDITRLQLRLAQLQVDFHRAALRNDQFAMQATMDAIQVARHQAHLNPATGYPYGLTSYRLPGREATNWDAYRYEEIIDAGYLYDREFSPTAVDPYTGQRRLKNVVWYPLYPLLGYTVKVITGLRAIGQTRPTGTGLLPFLASHGLRTVDALSLVSRLSAVGAAVVAFAFARRHFHNRIPRMELEDSQHVARRWDLDPADTAALWTVMFLFFNPVAVFLYTNFSESLFVLLMAMFLFCVQGRWWIRAAVVAALASACRSQGLLFAPTLAVTYLLRSDLRQFWKRLPMAITLGALSLAGVFAYMAYLNAAFGDALAFMHSQYWWNVGLHWAQLDYAINPSYGLTHAFYYVFLSPVDWPRLYEALCVIIPPVVIMLLGARFLSFEMELLAWLLWGLPYVSNSLAGSDIPHGHEHWMSMARFMLPVLPLEIILGAIAVRFRWSAALLLAMSASAFSLFAYLAGRGVWLG